MGGLVGQADQSTIKNCYVDGSVTGDRFVGGLVGDIKTYTIISNSYAICTVSGNEDIGGLIGTNYGTIQTSYSGGIVYDTKNQVGGFVGCNYDCILDCYATGVVTGKGNHIGGFAGANKEGNINYCYATGIITVTGSNSHGIGGLAGRYFGSTTCCHATGDIAVIGKASSIGGLIGYFSSSNGSITSSYAAGNIFTGTDNFDIGGLIGQDAYSNDNISNCYATGNIVAGTANYNVGGLAGHNYGIITYCYATGDISTTGGTDIGGLVGVNPGTIRNCVAANPSVSGSGSINRIVGSNGGVLSNNYADKNMTVNGTTVIGGTHNNANGEDKPMNTLMSFNFYNTGSNWYNSIIWDIDIVQNSTKTWGTCEGKTLPLLQCQGFSCSKNIPYEENHERGYPTAQNGKSTFSIFPNPTLSNITISSEKHFYAIKIVDLLGKVVYSQPNNGNNITLNVSGYSNGMYFVRIITENGTEMQKIYKKLT